MIIEEITYHEAIKRVFGCIHIVLNRLLRDISQLSLWVGMV